jgi:hypothetical protein
MKNDDASFNSLYKIVNYGDLTNKNNLLKKQGLQLNKSAQGNR